MSARLATPSDWPEVSALRQRVFVVEQGVPAELELDDRDATAVHALSRDDAGRVVATGRLLPDAAGPGRAVVGRMAADAAVRGRGHGSAVLAVLEAEAAARGQPPGERVPRLLSGITPAPAGHTILRNFVERFT